MTWSGQPSWDRRRRISQSARPVPCRHRHAGQPSRSRGHSPCRPAQSAPGMASSAWPAVKLRLPEALFPPPRDGGPPRPGPAQPGRADQFLAFPAPGPGQCPALALGRPHLSLVDSARMPALASVRDADPPLARPGRPRAARARGPFLTPEAIPLRTAPAARPPYPANRTGPSGTRRRNLLLGPPWTTISSSYIGVILL